MNELTIFNYEEQEVRTIIGEDGEPWWVAKDVCDILGIKRTYDAVNGLNDSEKKHIPVESVSGQQPRNMAIINETGLYLLIMRSRKPEAIDFQRWIASEVLPSIRKTGSYSVQPKIQSHLETAKLLVTALETIEADKPKVEYFDNVSETKTLFSMNTVAKLIGWGRNKLFAFLRNDSILMKGNTPYQHYIDAGYFETKEYNFGLHGQYTATTTFVTGKGRQWLFNRYGQ